MGIVITLVVGMTNRALSANTELYARGITQARADELAAAVREYVRFAQDEASQPVMQTGDFTQIVEHLVKRRTEVGAFILGYFYGNTTGAYISSDRATGNIGDRDYFQAVVRGGAASSIGSPAISRSLNIPIVVIAAPVTTNGRVTGMIGVQVGLAALSSSVTAINIDNAGYGFLIDRGGRMIAHSNTDFILSLDIREADKEGFSGLSGLGLQMVQGGSGTGRYRDQDGVLHRMFYSPVERTNWTLSIAVEDAYIMRTVYSLAFVVIGTGAIAIVVILLFSIGLGRSIARPVNLAVEIAGEIAAGNLVQEVPDRILSRKDELGSLAVALQSMIEKLRQVLGEVYAAVGQVSSGSQELSGTSQQMSQGASEQAASVEEISASMEQMSANIRQNAENATTTERIAQQSALVAEQGGGAVIRTVEAMRQIASRISIIEEIARSTNMLSLNASIEAARAGEYGKGFAVVASEVGKLAERSQKESGEISKLSAESVAVAEAAGKTIVDMIPEIRRTAELVQEITASSNEQNSGAVQINAAIGQLDQVVQQNASASEESASMAEELASQAEQLRETISYFRFEQD